MRYEESGDEENEKNMKSINKDKSNPFVSEKKKDLRKPVTEMTSPKENNFKSIEDLNDEQILERIQRLRSTKNSPMLFSALESKCMKKENDLK